MNWKVSRYFIVRRELLMNYKNFARLPAFGLLALAVISASGCAMTPADNEGSQGSKLEQGEQLQIRCATNLSPEHRVELDAIDAMISKSENYAALARLEALSFQTQNHWLRWAQLLGKVDQLDYSEDVYSQIAQACDSSQAYHGLGVVYVKAGKLEEGIRALSKAKSKEPASADIRNDFGIVLLQGGFYGQAAFELRTAYELSGREPGMGRNMVAAYYLHGGEDSLARIRQEMGLNDATIDAGIKFSKRFVRSGS